MNAIETLLLISRYFISKYTYLLSTNLQGILTEDTSEFWSASSVTTARDIKTRMISLNLTEKQTHIDSPLTMERIEQWRKHQTSILDDT